MSPESVFLILGASGGIGGAVARRLATEECRLLLAGRDEGRVSAIATELGAVGSSFDAVDPEAVEAACQQAISEHGRLDGIVNCVGSLLLRPAHLTSAEDFEEVLRTNLYSAFNVVRSGAKAMRENGGSIVLVATAAAQTGLPNHEAIAAAKAGVIGLGRSAAATYARQGLRVNIVSPGLVRTPLTERITSNPAAEKASLAMHALGRLGEPDDVARAITWLLDSDNGWVTGQVIGVDGGLATLRTKG